ncbi:nucleic acid-binding, OB-fold protein [Tanacetum coccineum]
MTSEGTSSKKTISDEAASPKEHMTSKNATFSKTVFAHAALTSSAFYLSIDMVVSDARGNAIHCTARAISARKSLAKSDGFVRHPFQLVELDSVNIFQMLLDTSLILEGPFNCEQALEPSTSTWPTKDKLYLSSSSSTRILDDADIPTLKELRSKNNVAEQTEEVMAVDFSKTRVGTLENLLLWAHNCRNDCVGFICQVRIKNIKTSKGWNFPTCSGENCKKGVGRKLGGWFRLELGVSDETGHVVVVMYDETASELLGLRHAFYTRFPVQSLNDDSKFPPTLTNIIGSTHALELKSHTYYEHGTFESFTCWKLHSSEAAEESAGSGTVDAIPDAQ